MARKAGALRWGRVDRSGSTPHRSRPLVPWRFSRGRRVCPYLFLGHACGRQRFPAAQDREEASRVFARELHRVEKYLFVRTLRTKRKASDRGARRQLRSRASELLQDASADGAARNDRLGVSDGGRFLGNGDGGVS